MNRDCQLKRTKFLAWCDCAKTCQQIGNYQLAIDYYDRALEIIPNNYSILRQKTHAIAQLNDYLITI